MNKQSIREYFKANDLNTGGDVFDKMKEVEEDLLAKAVVRCKANGRRTVQARDL